jgi:excisionase family DNA binding protein
MALNFDALRAALRGERTKLRNYIMQGQTTKAPLLVDAKEAARLLAVSARKLWSMTFEEQPGLPYVRCGRLVRYPLADLQAWIEAQRRGGNHEAR